MNLKVVIGALVQWAIRLAVLLMKKKANAEIKNELDKKFEEKKEEMREQEESIRKKYSDRRNNVPDSW